MSHLMFALALLLPGFEESPVPDRLEVYPLTEPIPAADVPKRDALDYVRDSLARLMAEGTDRYGPIHRPILMNIIDIRTGTSPADPLFLDEAFRVARRGRRAPGGANLYSDLPTLRAMYAVSRLTGDKRYAEFADTYLDHYFKNMIDDKGMLWWGYHRYYDAYADERRGFFGSHHEIHFQKANWDMLWAIDADVVAREIEGIWTWHVIDKTTGEINRHDNGEPGCDFAFTGGEIIYAFAFMYGKTGDARWLDRAHCVAGYFWGKRNPETNLLATRPNAGPKRFDGTHADTSTPGVYAQRLLASAELTRDAKLRGQAIAYLKAYAKLGWDEGGQSYWATLRLDGTPVPDAPEPVTDDYLKYQPRGHVDVWQPYAGGYECPVRAAQTYAYAAEVTDDPLLRTAALRWAKVIRKAWPPRTCDKDGWYGVYARDWMPYGCYAEQYGRCISVFLRLHRMTSDRAHLDFARVIANEAVAKLYDQGLFRGHPCKPYYEAIDGVGYLLYALVQLHETGPTQPLPASLPGNW